MLFYENTVQGTFLRRLNRFVAEVEVGGKTERVHVKNTGRLKELLLPGAQICLQRAGDPNRKTAYDLISVYKPGLEWVNIDSLAPNRLMKEYLEQQGYDLVKPEYSYGNSRVDFYMERVRTASASSSRTAHEMERACTASAVDKFLTEVKGCTLAVDTAAGIGMFPDAPTTRGVKHLDELAAAAKCGYQCQIAFVIQMNGIHRVLPNDDTQPEFGLALRRAVQAGVLVCCYSCKVAADSIEITSFIDDSESYRGI